MCTHPVGCSPFWLHKLSMIICQLPISSPGSLWILGLVWLIPFLLRTVVLTWRQHEDGYDDHGANDGDHCQCDAQTFPVSFVVYFTLVRFLHILAIGMGLNGGGGVL